MTLAINGSSPSIQTQPASNAPAPKRLKKCAPPERPVKTLFAAKAGIYFSSALLCILSGSVTFWLRLASQAGRMTILHDIAKAQVASVSDSLRIVLSGSEMGQLKNERIEMNETGLVDGLLLAYRKEKGVVAGASTRAAAKKLARETMEIRSKIERMADGEAVPEGMRGLIGDLSRVMKSPFYQTVEAQDSDAANFLQFIAVKLIAADGSRALSNYGKKCLGPLEEDSFSPVRLADLMSDYLKKPGFSYKGLNRALYVVCHPDLTVHSIESELDPLGYDASKGNPNFSAHTFEEDGKKMTFYFGPGPTGNPIFEHGVLPAYEKFGVFELRFNHQDTSKRSEYFRVKEILRMGRENPEVLRHALLGFDTKMTRNKTVEFNDPDAFFKSYREYVKNGARGQKTRTKHSGFDIPDRLLSDPELDVAIGKAQEFCSALSRDNPFWNEMMRLKGPSGCAAKVESLWHKAKDNPKALYPLLNPGKARMAKMMQLITDTFLTLGMLYRSFDAITPEMADRAFDEKLDRDLTALRTSGACKQNVDRAVVENMSLRLFFRWAKSDKPLTREEVYEIAGAVFGRARLVDDRLIMHNRYKILDDLLRFVGSAPGGVSAAHKLLKGYRGALSGRAGWFPTLF